MVATIVFLLLLSSPAYAFRFASGFFKGTALSRTIDISDTSGEADFEPDVVFVKCDSATNMVWRTAAMADGESFLIAATTGAVTDNIQAFSATGFQVGTQARVNGSGVDCWYLALANDASNDLSIGSYFGDGTDSQDIVISPAFLPQFVMLQRSGTSPGRWRTSAMAGDLTCLFSSGACATDHIKALNADGFEVGTATSVNSSTGDTTFYYLAIKAVSGTTATGSFTGNTSDNRQITTLGFQPQAMIIKGNSATQVPCLRFKDNSGDESFRADGGAPAANQIQNFISNGFEVGTASCANEDAVTMYFYALKEPAGAPSTRRPIAPIIFQ